MSVYAWATYVCYGVLWGGMILFACIQWWLLQREAKKHGGG